SSSLSGRIKSFHAEARRHAVETKRPINSGPCPAWLTRTKEKFAFIEGAREVIEYIFARTIEGIGGKRLCQELNAKFATFGPDDPDGKRKRKWNDRYMRTILDDRRAIGEMQPYVIDDAGKRQRIGMPIANYYPAAVDEATWRAAQAATANRRVERGPSGDFVN